MATPTPSEDATLRVTSSSPLTPVYPSDAQFSPGTIIANRYRIASMLGKGGMGEVYRADDLKLGQPVALKFLPQTLERDSVLLAQLHEEVRMGRQVTHPNVCRIYDIDEEASGHFVVMEFVDGEDLARLLRRIGRLPNDKGVEVARGIAAGLAAAHAKGILHRDLKPANVMIDSHGEARITDFGLAMPTEEALASDVLVGTPAYLAPEQLDGKPASVQSDLYALGLVMYELFTGRRARSGRTFREIHDELTTEISRPSQFVRDIDPAVERVITRCLNRDPAQRPRSAREVFEALPGADPLAAALAAGETPSPRLVAAAGSEGTLSPRAAWTWAALFAVALAGLLAVSSQWRIMHFLPMEKPLDVLDARAVEIARAVGVDAGPIHVEDVVENARYLHWVEKHITTWDRWKHLDRGPAAVTYWTRRGSAPFTPVGESVFATRDDPPRRDRADTTIELDLDGRLLALAAAPPATIRSTPAGWAPLFAFAGIDPSKLRSVQPGGPAPMFAEQRAAWDGVWPDDPARPLHVEAAAARGVPVWFRVTGPWDDRPAEEAAFSNTGLSLFLLCLRVLVLGAAVLLAWRNVRLRRGDRVGAARLAAAVIVAVCLAELLAADHRVSYAHESTLLGTIFRDALFGAAAFTLFYLAAEPTVRRRWPHVLIGWSRLLAGNFRDPLVGREILIGAAAGVFHGLLAASSDWLPGRMGWRLPMAPHYDRITAIHGFRYALGMSIERGVSAIFFAFVMCVFLAGAVFVFRRHSFAVAALFLAQAGAYVFAAHGNPFIFAAGMLISAVCTAVIVRVGLLSVAAMQVVFGFTFLMPVSVDVSSWAAPSLVTPLIITIALVIFAFRVALGSQPAFAFSDD